MGMDLSVYRIKGFSKTQDETGISQFLLNSDTKDFFLKNFTESKNFIFENKYLHSDKLKEEFYKDGVLYDYDFTVSPGWLQYVEENDIQERTHLIEVGNPQDYIYTDDWGIFVEVEEIGYMRKPFRHNDTPSLQEGDTITFYVDNFTGAKEGLNKLLGEDALNKSYLLLTYADKDKIKQLAEYCYDKKNWLENIYAKVEKDTVIVIDW